MTTDQSMKWQMWFFFLVLFKTVFLKDFWIFSNSCIKYFQKTSFLKQMHITFSIVKKIIEKMMMMIMIMIFGKFMNFVANQKFFIFSMYRTTNYALRQRLSFKIKIVIIPERWLSALTQQFDLQIQNVGRLFIFIYKLHEVHLLTYPDEIHKFSFWIWQEEGLWMVAYNSFLSKLMILFFAYLVNWLIFCHWFMTAWINDNYQIDGQFFENFYKRITKNVKIIKRKNSKKKKKIFFPLVLINWSFYYGLITLIDTISPIFEIGWQFQGFDLNFKIANKNCIGNIRGPCPTSLILFLLNYFDFLSRF